MRNDKSFVLYPKELSKKPLSSFAIEKEVT